MSEPSSTDPIPPSTAPSQMQRAAVEWPTLILAVAIYGGWAALTYWHAAIPAVFLIPAAAWLIAWHSSLQHEVIHGHPFRWRGLNRALGFVPLSLWIPFERYRALHLSHHRDERLTDPLDDPESYYWTRADWGALSPPARWLVAVQTSLAGRLIIGPFWAASRFLAADLAALRAGNRVVVRIWGWHLLGCAGVMGWVWGVCAMSPLTYLMVVVYPGTALLLLRSFAEHKAEEAVPHRTAVVENAPLLGLLFLNNNLHAVHHARPTLPWYRLPAWYRAHRSAIVAANGGLVYDGYREVALRYLWRAHDQPMHLGERPPHPVPASG